MTACIRCGFRPDAHVIASWEFVVPRTVKSGNAHVHNVGAGRHVYRKERDGWAADFRFFKHQQRIPDATGKRRVTLTRIIGHRQRPFDTDNLGTGLKPCVDAMVSVGLLQGDTPSQAEIHRQQEKRHGVGLHVLIEELAP